MQNKNYWIKRFEALEKSSVKKGDDLYALIQDEFDKASKSLQSEISYWYARFAANNEISITEAKQWLKGKDLAEFKWTVEEYIKKAEANKLHGAWIKQLENASAKVHISRFESLQIQLQQELELLYGNQLDKFDKVMTEIYSDKFYHTAFELEKGFGVGWSLSKLEDSQLAKILNKPWTLDKITFSDRIWNNKADLLNKLQTDLTQSMLLGKNPYQVTKEVAKRFDVSKTQAGRLVMTESAYFASAGQKDCFESLGVERYEIVATLDSRTSFICQELDGKVEEMKNYQVGVTAPPFHPWCRTTTCPYFDDTPDYVTRAARDKDGKTIQVPANMKYSDWYNQYIKSDLTKSLESAIIGLKTKDNRVVKSINPHLSDQSELRKFSVEETKNALLKPLRITEIKYNKNGKPSIQYIGNEVTVAYNPKLDMLVTGWRTGKAKKKKYGGDIK